jgi:hypothetical protein
VAKQTWWWLGSKGCEGVRNAKRKYKIANERMETRGVAEFGEGKSVRVADLCGVSF